MSTPSPSRPTGVWVEAEAAKIGFYRRTVRTGVDLEIAGSRVVRVFEFTSTVHGAQALKMMEVCLEKVSLGRKSSEFVPGRLPSGERAKAPLKNSTPLRREMQYGSKQ